MSIYASHDAPGDMTHVEGCALYVESPRGSGIYEFSGKPCDCGLPGAPIVYEGSHVLPSDDDRRGGCIDIASIPGHISREDRPPMGDEWDAPPHPWLRLGIHAMPSEIQYKGKPYVSGGDATVVLDRRQVEHVRDTLTDWLDATVAPAAHEPKKRRRGIFVNLLPLSSVRERVP